MMQYNNINELSVIKKKYIQILGEKNLSITNGIIDVNYANSLKIENESIEMFVSSNGFIKIINEYINPFDSSCVERIYDIISYFTFPTSMPNCLEQIKFAKKLEFLHTPFYLLKTLFDFVKLNGINNIYDFETLDYSLLLYFLCENSEQMQLNKIIDFVINFSNHNYSFDISREDFFNIIPIKYFNGIKSFDFKKILSIDDDYLYGIAILCAHNNFKELKLIFNYCFVIYKSSNKEKFPNVELSSLTIEKTKALCSIGIMGYFGCLLNNIYSIAVAKNNQSIIEILLEIEQSFNYFENSTQKQYLLIHYAIELNNQYLLEITLNLKLYTINDLINNCIDYTISNNNNNFFIIIYNYIQQNKIITSKNFNSFLLLKSINMNNPIIFNWIINNVADSKKLIFTNFKNIVETIAKNDYDVIFEILMSKFTNDLKYVEMLEYLLTNRAFKCLKCAIKFKPDGFVVPSKYLI